MKIYLHNQAGKKNNMFVTPDMPECPSEWVDHENNRLTFRVRFEDGMADVDPKLGSYMISKGMAYRSRLIRPTVNIVRAVFRGARA